MPSWINWPATGLAEPAQLPGVVGSERCFLADASGWCEPHTNPKCQRGQWAMSSEPLIQAEDLLRLFPRNTLLLTSLVDQLGSQKRRCPARCREGAFGTANPGRGASPPLPREFPLPGV